MILRDMQGAVTKTSIGVSKISPSTDPQNTWVVLSGVRSSRLLHMIDEQAPTVLCLQEIDAPHADFWLESLESRGYAMVYKKRTSADKLDGVAVAWKNDTFCAEPENVIEVEYRDDDPLSYMNRDNVGLVVTLKRVGVEGVGEKHLVVANTHLLFNQKRGDVKLGQVSRLLTRIAVTHRYFLLEIPLTFMTGGSS